jgi:hypothetical protein
MTMGTWGPGLFADDDAADLRSDYRNYLAEAQSDAGATDAAAREYGASLDRLGETTAFWLALASIQWRLGRLDPRVKAAALTIIDDGLDLAKWENSPDRRKRGAVLAKLRETLGSAMLPARQFPKPLPVQLPGWEFAEVVGYRAPNRKYVLLHVIGYHAWSLLAVRAPTVTVLNWFAETVPGADDIKALTYINHDGRIGGHHILCLAMPRRSALTLEAFDRPGWHKPVTRGEATSAIYGLSAREGGTLDSALAKVLWPYWEDQSRPVHVPKSFPPDMDMAECQRTVEELKRRLFGGP